MIYNIKPLVQTLDDIKQDFLNQIFLKAIIDNKNNDNNSWLSRLSGILFKFRFIKYYGYYIIY